MNKEDILISYMPKLSNPTLIVAFEGWANAMDVARGVMRHLIGQMKGIPFAALNPDNFYSYDSHRPIVDIQSGMLKSISSPGGNFHAVQTAGVAGDLVLLDASEPSLNWGAFAESLFAFCEQLGVCNFISLGSLYDNVLHTDQVFSALVSNLGLLNRFEPHTVQPISYQGPGAIHSLLHAEAVRRELTCVSIWAHCPYFLEGNSHFGHMALMGRLLSVFCGFSLDVTELEGNWHKLAGKIEERIEQSEQVKNIVEELRKVKRKGSLSGVKPKAKKHGKVIDLADFFDSKE